MSNDYTRKVLVWADDDALLDGFKFAWGWLQNPAVALQSVTPEGHWLYIEDDAGPAAVTFELDAADGLRVVKEGVDMLYREGEPVEPVGGRPKRMTRSVDTLAGRALDWAVAKARGIEFTDENAPYHHELVHADWSVAGQIIEEYRIDLVHVMGAASPDEAWEATNMHGTTYFGGTPLIAVLRAFVSYKAGNIINIPTELLR